MLLLLGLIVAGQLSLCIVDSVSDEAALVLGSLDVLSDPLHFDVLLVERRLGIHDVTVDSVVVRVQVSVLAFELL